MCVNSVYVVYVCACVCVWCVCMCVCVCMYVFLYVMCTSVCGKGIACVRALMCVWHGSVHICVTCVESAIKKTRSHLIEGLVQMHLLQDSCYLCSLLWTSAFVHECREGWV